MDGEGVSHVMQAWLVTGIRGFAHNVGTGSQAAECHLGVLPGHRVAVSGNKEG